jgi:hypothetical protein
MISNQVLRENFIWRLWRESVIRLHSSCNISTLLGFEEQLHVKIRIDTCIWSHLLVVSSLSRKRTNHPSHCQNGVI